MRRSVWAGDGKDEHELVKRFGGAKDGLQDPATASIGYREEGEQILPVLLKRAVQPSAGGTPSSSTEVIKARASSTKTGASPAGL